MTSTTSAKLRISSLNVRAFLRNLWINGVACALILGLFFLTDFFKITTLTSALETVVFWAVVAGMITWIAFLMHWFGELFLHIRRNNYHYLWSLLPFFLPVICLLAHTTVLGWFPWPFD